MLQSLKKATAAFLVYLILIGALPNPEIVAAAVTRVEHSQIQERASSHVWNLQLSLSEISRSDKKFAEFSAFDDRVELAPDIIADQAVRGLALSPDLLTRLQDPVTREEIARYIGEENLNEIVSNLWAPIQSIIAARGQTAGANANSVSVDTVLGDLCRYFDQGKTDGLQPESKMELPRGFWKRGGHLNAAVGRQVSRVFRLPRPKWQTSLQKRWINEGIGQQNRALQIVSHQVSDEDGLQRIGPRTTAFIKLSNFQRNFLNLFLGATIFVLINMGIEWYLLQDPSRFIVVTNHLEETESALAYYKQLFVHFPEHSLRILDKDTLDKLAWEEFWGSDRQLPKVAIHYVTNLKVFLSPLIFCGILGWFLRMGLRRPLDFGYTVFFYGMTLNLMDDLRLHGVVDYIAHASPGDVWMFLGGFLLFKRAFEGLINMLKQRFPARAGSGESSSGRGRS